MFYKIGINPLLLNRIPSISPNTNSKETFVGWFKTLKCKLKYKFFWGGFLTFKTEVGCYYP